MRTAEEWGYVPRSPVRVRAAREPRTPGRRFTVEERERLLAVADPKLRAWLVAARYTGARRSSLWRLRVGDIDPTLGTITFRQAKAGGYTIPLHPALVAE
jgi:integrase